MLIKDLSLDHPTNQKQNFTEGQVHKKTTCTTHNVT